MNQLQGHISMKLTGPKHAEREFCKKAEHFTTCNDEERESKIWYLYQFTKLQTGVQSRKYFIAKISDCEENEFLGNGIEYHVEYYSQLPSVL